MLETIIVDDETDSRTILQELLLNNYPEIEVIATASCINEAYKLIYALKPALIFLDIEFSDGSGFDLIHQFEDPHFDVIFVSSNTEYAVNAFEVSAIDYLLKPISEQKLLAAIRKVNNKHKPRDLAKIGLAESIQSSSLAALSKMETASQDIAIPVQQGIKMLTINEILRCEGSNGYTIFHLQDNRQIVSSQHMAPFQEILCKHNFFRIHTSHLINRNFIDEYSHVDGGCVIMKDGARLPVSSRRKRGFLDWLKGVVSKA